MSPNTRPPSPRSVHPQGERGYCWPRTNDRSRRSSNPGHQQTERALVGAGGQLADDGAVGHHEDAVGEGADLVELDRDEEDRAARGAQFEEAAMDELDGADIDAPRRLADPPQFRLPRDPAGADQLLLIAAGTLADAAAGIGRPHVILAHARQRLGADRLW